MSSSFASWAEVVMLFSAAEGMALSSATEGVVFSTAEVVKSFSWAGALDLVHHQYVESLPSLIHWESC